MFSSESLFINYKLLNVTVNQQQDRPECPSSFKSNWGDIHIFQFKVYTHSFVVICFAELRALCRCLMWWQHKVWPQERHQVQKLCYSTWGNYSWTILILNLYSIHLTVKDGKSYLYSYTCILRKCQKPVGKQSILVPLHLFKWNIMVNQEKYIQCAHKPTKLYGVFRGLSMPS